MDPQREIRILGAGCGQVVQVSQNRRDEAAGRLRPRLPLESDVIHGIVIAHPPVLELAPEVGPFTRVPVGVLVLQRGGHAYLPASGRLAGSSSLAAATGGPVARPSSSMGVAEPPGCTK